MAFKKVKDMKLLGKLLSLLENYRTSYQVKYSIEKPGFGNVLYDSGDDLFFAKKSYELCLGESIVSKICTLTFLFVKFLRQV